MALPLPSLRLTNHQVQQPVVVVIGDFLMKLRTTAEWDGWFTGSRATGVPAGGPLGIQRRAGKRTVIGQMACRRRAGARWPERFAGR